MKHHEKQILKLRQTPTCGYKTLIPKVSGIFSFLLRVCGPVLQPSYVHLCIPMHVPVHHVHQIGGLTIWFYLSCMHGSQS